MLVTSYEIFQVLHKRCVGSKLYNLCIRAWTNGEFKPLGCLQLKVSTVDGPQWWWTYQLLCRSAWLPCPSPLRLTSLPLVSVASLRLMFYTRLCQKARKLFSTNLQDCMWGVCWLEIGHVWTQFYLRAFGKSNKRSNDSTFIQVLHYICYDQLKITNLLFYKSQALLGSPLWM